MVTLLLQRMGYDVSGKKEVLCMKFSFACIYFDVRPADLSILWNFRDSSHILRRRKLESWNFLI